MNRNRAAYGAIAASLLALLAACSSSGSVNIGHDQGVDPGTVDFPIAYVKHYFTAETLPAFDKLNNPGRTRLAVPTADLFIRSSASPSATETNITGSMTAGGNFDIKDVDVSPDGKKLIFSMRGPIAANANERDAPFWTLWEYDVAQASLQQVIDTGLFPVGANDVSPHYLPDGSIVFSSTRQRGSRAVLLDENQPGFEAQFQGAGESAFLLHVLSPDRTDIQQITYNQGHDLWPETLSDTTALPDNPQGTSFIPRKGRIVFSRWDSSGGGMSLYTVNADGSGLQLLYGARSHAAGVDGNDLQFTRPREMTNGRILTLMRPFDEDTDLGGDLLIIDASNYVENMQPLVANATLTGPAQQRVSPNEIKTIEGPSPGGRFHSAYPLWDGSGRILVSWSLCRLQDTTAAAPVPVPCTTQHLADPTYKPAPPLYSGFIFNPADNTFKPLFPPVEDVMVSDLIAVQARTQPWSKATEVARPLLADQGVGVLSIRSVYDFDGTQAHTTLGAGTASCPLSRTIPSLANPLLCSADDRPARFIRIEEAVSRFDRRLDMSLPDIDFNAAVGSGVGFMRTILGYAPIEPDGSVSVRVPANLPFTFSILDKDGRRLPQFGQHASWLQMRPGEERHCNGCHQAPGGTAIEKSHGRDGTSISAWAGTDATIAFPSTQPAVAIMPQSGDTMALARARATCIGSGVCSEVPRVNLVDVNFWNTPVTTPATDPTVLVNLSYAGIDGITTPAPISSAGCQTNWTSTCRIVINYETHIHPLWSKLRQEFDPNDASIVTRDNTCTRCHAPIDAMGNAQLPAGQLDLSDGDRDQATQHKNAYTELVTGGEQQQLDLVTGQLVFVTIMVDSGAVDPVTGAPILVPQPVPESRRLTPLSARGSTRFFNRFTAFDAGTQSVDHTTFLTSGELRLISEWTDIGAQYYNNQFDPDAPKN